MAAAVRSPVAPFMAISLQAPSNSTRTSVMPSANSNYQAAGRRKLERFRAGRNEQRPPRRGNSNGELERRESPAPVNPDATSVLPAVSSSGADVEPELTNVPDDSPATFSFPGTSGENLLSSENHLQAPSSEDHHHQVFDYRHGFSLNDVENRSPNIMLEAPGVSGDSSFNFSSSFLDSRLIAPEEGNEVLPRGDDLRLVSAEENEGPRVDESTFGEVELPGVDDSRLASAEEIKVPRVDGPVPVFTSSLPRHSSFVALDIDHATMSSSRDDFAALEQHIEDLTQEKFSLQRCLDNARAVAETLSRDNSALTEDYNQQGAKVLELKDELTRCQELIRSQENVINSLSAEKDKYHHECIVAMERARTFAAEVVHMEEKLLKIRSQELKFQKEVESLRAEIESSRRQILSIEKDRSNAISMNDALQEEKKVLLARIREAAFDKPATPQAPVPLPKEDASTSTDDLVAGNESSSATVSSEEETTSYPTSLPPDHLGIIESINNLVIELGEEKNDLLRALRNETTAVAQLKAENTELSQRLERQTQQLELAFAQNLARAGGSSSSPIVSQPAEEVEYIDEGDEVVDRVLGWIMRLFPGKRGGSKQL